MKQIIISVIVLAVLILLAIFWYFFGSTIISLTGAGATTNIVPNVTQEIIEPELTKQEQRGLLQELAPENPIDTPEEIDEQIQLLEQLQSL